MQNLKSRPQARLSDFYDFWCNGRSLHHHSKSTLFLSEIQYGRHTERHLDLRLLDQEFPVKYQKIDHLDTTISQ